MLIEAEVTPLLGLTAIIQVMERKKNTCIFTSLTIIYSFCKVY